MAGVSYHHHGRHRLVYNRRYLDCHSHREHRVHRQFFYLLRTRTPVAVGPPRHNPPPGPSRREIKLVPSYTHSHLDTRRRSRLCGPGAHAMSFGIFTRFRFGTSSARARAVGCGLASRLYGNVGETKNGRVTNQEQRMSYYRILEHRALRAKIIHHWKPWEKSTRRKSQDGKKKGSKNEYKRGEPYLMRGIRAALRDHGDIQG